MNKFQKQTNSIGIKRRNFMQRSLFGTALAAFGYYVKVGNAFAAVVIEKLTLSDAAWKKKLTPTQYAILREEGTEPPFTSALLKEHREGLFVCAGCDLPLFSSETKYDSGTGWPSFYKALEGRLAMKTDYKLIAPRTEYRCARCGGHHGHVFDDGPKPTGLRHCNNGAVLKFIPKEA